MPKGWGWWVLGTVACILLGVMWAAAGNPAAYPGLRATMSNLVEWLETHDGAITALATIAIAAFTYTLYRSTEKLWKAGEQQIALAQTSAETTRRALDHTRTVERAYVKMSHVEPGLIFTTDGTVRVTVQVKNFGRTPANVTDVILTPFVVRPPMALPERPIYEGTQGHPSARAFLVANDRIFTHATFALPEFQQVLLGQLTLYLFGYVDMSMLSDKDTVAVMRGCLWLTKRRIISFSLPTHPTTTMSPASRGKVGIGTRTLPSYSLPPQKGSVARTLVLRLSRFEGDRRSFG